MRITLVVLAAALAAGCGSGQPGARVERYGISVEVPEGWDGEVSRGVVRLSDGDLSVTMYEYEPQPGQRPEEVASYFDDGWPVRLQPADFRRQQSGDGSEEDAIPVSVAGRLFSVFTEGTPSAVEERIDELNDALARIEVEAGDFYRGTVRPVEFPERPGWYPVSSGPGTRYAWGESVQTAAATIPYRNDANDLPPVRTLEALPKDGLLFWVSLSRDSHLPPSRLREGDTFAPRRPPPYGLTDLQRVDGWEGQVRDIPEYRLWASVAERYLLDLRIYFGQKHPTDAMLAEADAVLRALRLPDWGPWELEPP